MTGTVKVKPTTAYIQDSNSGKLTLYVPYYGVTGIGQITLSSNGSSDVQLQNGQLPMEILTKSATATTASVTFELEGEDAPPSSSSGSVLIDNNYALTNPQGSYEIGNGFSGSLSYSGGDGWIKTNGTLTKNSSGKYVQEFTLTPNDSESPRSGAVIVFSPSGREVTRFVINQQGKIPATSLVSDKSANCYIITAKGTYELPAYMGAHSSLTGQKKCTGKPHEVWNDSNNTIQFLNADSFDDRIVFKVENDITPGNAVVAIRDKDGVIQWSWHLWFCTSDPSVDDDEPSGTPMDRNLGAKTSATDGIALIGDYLSLYWKDGLYYQWGRKDPLNINITSGSDAYAKGDGGSLGDAIKHPNTFYKGWSSADGWSTSKSDHDPCPVGYKVATGATWSKQKSDFNRYINTNQYIFVYELSTDPILYPYNGYLNESGEKKDGISGLGVLKSSTYNMISVLGYKDYPLYPADQDGLSSKPNENPRRYDSATYTIKDDKKVGVVYGVDKSLEYGYEDKGIEITAHQCDEGVWESYTTGLINKKTKYRAKYSSNWTQVKSEITNDGRFDDKLPDNVREKFNGYIKADYTMSNLGSEIKNFIQSLGDLSAWFQAGVVYNKNDINPKYGYNVRCIKE